MKRYLSSALFVSAALFISNSSAATDETNAQLRAQIQQISMQTKALQQEVNALKAELRRRPAQPVQKVIVHEVQTVAATPHHCATPQPCDAHHPCAAPAPCEPEGPWHVYNLPLTVTTSPFLGVKSVYNATDLLHYFPSVNEDLVLLQHRQELVNHLCSFGQEITRPIVEISGAVEAQMYDSGGWAASPSDRGINLSNAELDFNATPNDWANAFFSLNYDNSPISEGSRQPNGRIYVRRGFVNIGNLNEFPFYGTLGEMYVPFGRYASALVSTPLTQSLARIRTAVALLGYYCHGFNASIFGYSGFRTSGSVPILKQGGFNISYKGPLFGDWIHIKVGGGAVTNIADSEGMQFNGYPLSTSNTVFAGFGARPPFSDAILHDVAGGDINAEVDIGHFSFIGEVATALDNFSRYDLTYNNHGAQPGALHTEVDYNWDICDKPATFGLIYGRTWDALALNLPENSYAAVFSISLLRDTVQSIEFRHDTDYSKRATAGGRASLLNGINGTGSSRNSVVAQVGVYF